MLDRLGRHGRPARGQLAGVVGEEDDAETIVRPHHAEGPSHRIGRAAQLGLHAARDIEHDDPVRALDDLAQVHARRDHQHELAGSLARPIGQQIHSSRMIRSQPVVDRDVLVQRGRALLTVDPHRPGVRCVLRYDGLAGGVGSHVVQRIRRANRRLEGELAANDLLPRPERLRLVVDLAVLQRIDVAPRACIDLDRLHVQQPHPCA